MNRVSRREEKESVLLAEKHAYRMRILDKTDDRCIDIRRGRNPSQAPETISGIESSQVLALLGVLTEELFILRKEVSKLKGQEL